MRKTVTFLILCLVIAAVGFPTAALADSNMPPPVPITGPRLSPPPIPNSKVIAPSWIYNNVIVSNLPEGSRIADTMALSNKPGILKSTSNIASGTTLSYHNAPAPTACNDFNTTKYWVSQVKVNGAPLSDVWTDHYADWGSWAVDDGFYQARNTVFSLERVVGPGEHYGSGYSAKVGSTQPYIGGFASPLISVTPGAQVTVRVRYLIFNHGNIATDNQWAYDFASLAVKPDGLESPANYVNGYTRGEWWVMENTVTAGPSGQIMIFLQGNSPAALNSNIYFDDVEIIVDGKAMSSCIWK
ncbi:MAG: hypothetical protein D6790_18435 [Caldilineae bacterium]|nr:MAG: hypothetical protein D6790_18435 [Caldilineae bacterium]